MNDVVILSAARTPVGTFGGSLAELPVVKLGAVAIAEEPHPEVSLESANRIVAGGWGLHSVGGFKPIEELARILGAVVGGTRPAVDEGWIPEDLMIGQSGKTVSPELFISIGASGAMHYTTGFSRSKVVLAVDRNPEAPIFQMADVGIVGDLEDILPCLISCIFYCCKNYLNSFFI